MHFAENITIITAMHTSNPIFPKTLVGFYKRNFFRYCGTYWLLWTGMIWFNNITFRSMPPLYTKWFIEILEKFGATKMLFPKFMAFAIMIITIISITHIVFTFAVRLRDKIIPRSADLVSRDLYRYVYNQTIDFYTRTMPGKTANQITLISGILHRTYSDIFGTLFSTAIIFFLNMGLIFKIDKRVALVLFCGIVIRFIWTLSRRRPFSKKIRIASEAQSTLNGKLLDGLSNFVIVKLFAGAYREEMSVDKTRKDHINAMDKMRFQQRLFFITPWYFDGFFTTLAMFFIAIAFAKGGMGIADAMFILTAYTMLSGLIWDVVYSLPDILDSYNMAAEAYQKLICPIKIKDAKNAKDLRISKGAIEIKNLSFRYGRRKVLDNLSLSISPGEKVGLVGVSGAGKTTLVNLIMRMYDPDHGAVMIDGQDLRTVTLDSLRENIAFIPQEPSLFNRTLAENISYGRMDVTMPEIKNAAQHASADEFINKAAHKYGTLVGDRGIKLSGGQKQRVAIARAFLKNAPILILDEATSALDSETESVVQKSISEISSGRTTIAIAHRLSTLRRMDRLIVMDRGRIIESGTHKELVKKTGGVYARLWKMHSEYFIKK